jgi:glycosyltransferase involved in cell wall biosynthesis
MTLVTETYFPQVNGVSRTLAQLVRHLTAAGDQVQLIHPAYGVAHTVQRGEVSVPVRSVVAPFYPELHLPLPPFRGVHRAIDAFEPDLVHIATEATLGLSVLRHASRSGLRTVSSFHTNFHQYSDHYGVGWAKGAIWRYLRWWHNQTSETYVPSRATIAELLSRGFQRLVLWPRGVDAELFRPDRPGRSSVREALGIASEHVVIGYAGRIAAEKNVARLAEALRRVAEARAQVRLLFVGDGPARAELERLLGPAARFVGYRSGEDLADHYAAADLFAFASLTETFGNVVLEAMASGLPVVALRSGGVRDTVRSGVTGTLIDPDAPPAHFAEALLDLVDDAGARHHTAQAARSYALTQGWDTVMGTLRQRYEQLVWGGHPSLSARVGC